MIPVRESAPPAAPPTLGVDFDNTLICNDTAFHAAAVERGLVPASVPATKEAVRDHLRAAGREEDWTELQGHVYGERILSAPPFPGALPFLASAIRRGVPVRIISHRTRRPYRGPAVDLHAAALGWLERHGCFDPRGVGLRPEAVSFHETKEAKLERIAVEGCAHFVDDLPEILLSPRFPAATARILFAPAGPPPLPAGGAVACLASWAAVAAHLAAAWEGAA